MDRKDVQELSYKVLEIDLLVEQIVVLHKVIESSAAA